MTVIHLVPAMEQGGVETVVCDLNRALVRAGWRSVVVSSGGRLAEQVRAAGGEHVALDLKSKNPLTALTRAWKLRGAIRRIGGGLVCAHSRVPAWLYVLARKSDARLGALPFITYAHGANSVSAYSAVMTAGDRVIVPSRFLADYLEANYASAASGRPSLASRLRIVRPAVDFSRFDPAKVDPRAVEGLRRAWGLRAGDRVAMAVGRITPVKGLDHLIRDLAGRLDVAPAAGWADALRAPGTKLVLVGGAERGREGHLDALKGLAASLGVADRVVFAGAQADVPACLSLADLVVSGNVTKPESFGLSVAEALAMDRPVRLLRHFGGAAEILDAVAAEGRPSRRESVRALCDPDALSARTRAVYGEVCKI